MVRNRHRPSKSSGSGISQWTQTVRRGFAKLCQLQGSKRGAAVVSHGGSRCVQAVLPRCLFGGPRQRHSGHVMPSGHPTADRVRFPMLGIYRRKARQSALLVRSESYPLGMPSSSDLVREANIVTRRLAACCVLCQGHSCCTVARVSGFRGSEGKGID